MDRITDLEGRMIECADHLHGHIIDPCVVRGGRCQAPAAPAPAAQ